MELKNMFFIWLMVILINNEILDSTELCSDNDPNKYTSLFLITFGSGSDQYSNKTPSDFGFTTTYHRKSSKMGPEQFIFINSVPYVIDWHGNEPDHTPNDNNGYMYFVDIAESDSQIFSMTVNGLCVGLRYVFSAYLANVNKLNKTDEFPEIRFEVQTAIVQNGVIARSPTYTIYAYGKMTWSKYDVPFIASSTSVVLLMITLGAAWAGHDLAIDDIELGVCSMVQTGECPSDSARLCSDNDINSGPPLLLITFGSGPDQYSKKSPSDFNFTTTYPQPQSAGVSAGYFDFINSVQGSGHWHANSSDHTPNDIDGYMYLINFDKNTSQIFNSTINDLCLGFQYTFSAYLANVNQQYNENRPNVRFEVRSATGEKPLLAQSSTGDIPEYDNMTWSKYGLSFIASTYSVVLLMISMPKAGDMGDDVAIDDIELRVCSTIHSGVCPFGCLPTKITFISKPSDSSIVEYTLKDDIYISSNIETNCAQTYPIDMQWTILNGSTVMKLDANIKTTLKDIYIPSKTLSYGSYQFNLTVTIRTGLSNLITSESINLTIIRSEKIIVNLIAYGLSEITLGQSQELLLEPGKYSIDTDGNKINEDDWENEYYCRIYHLEQSLAPIQTSSCGLNKINRTKSSLKVFSSTFQANRSYQFQVQVYDPLTPSLQYTGYLLVHIQATDSYRIALGCIISTMCIADAEYQLINPTTQVALFSYCIENCPSNYMISWHIYYSTRNLITNITQWTLFNQPVLTYGNNTKNFTVTNELFSINSTIEYWQFKVIYSFQTSASSSSINFKKNSPPSNGYCAINSSNGTITTVFNISCFNWTDNDGIKDYSFYVWTSDSSQQTIIGFSSIPTLQTRLPRGNTNNSLLYLNVHIRDKFDCIQQSNTLFVDVNEDRKQLENLINSVEDSKLNLADNPFIQTLLTGNQNNIGQTITAVSQEFNQINSESLENALSNGIPLASISVSSLDSKPSESVKTSVVPNQTVVEEYKKQVNLYANTREYLINFATNLTIAGLPSILLQASSIVQLTEATNQLTRYTAITAVNKCYDLAISLNQIAHETRIEEVQKAVDLISQCASNIINGINGPLQERFDFLQLDLQRANQALEKNQCVEEQNVHQRNFCYQTQLANQILDKIKKILSLLTLSFNNHLNAGQQHLVNTSQVYMSYEKISNDSFSNKTIGYNAQFQIKFPNNLSSNSDEHFFLQTKFEGLAPYGNYPSNTNLSRSISIALLDKNGHEMKIKTKENPSIELVIPRDPNLILPEMILQNVTNVNQSSSSFYYKFINLTQLQPNPHLTISIHFQIRPINSTLAYIFIYQLSQKIQFDRLDGYQFFCSYNLTGENMYTYYIDNQRLSKHQSMIFGLRELTLIEYENVCVKNSTENFQMKNVDANFTSDYYLRIYTSGCYYLDQDNNWQSNGLLVGPKTNIYQTQCFTNHL